MRLPSNGMGFASGFMRGSVIILSHAALRASFDGQTIHENTTVSSFLHWTAIGNDVILPSGISSPQHSVTLSAPYSLKMAAASSACFLNFSRLTVGTAALQRRRAPATGHWFANPVFAKALHPTDRRTGADLEFFGRLASRSSSIDKVNYAHSQLTRVRSAHCPALRRINALDSLLRSPLGIPIHSGRDVL